VVTGQGQQSNGSRLLQVTFRGNGWGHGLGMSQYGALGMASRGYNYQEILKYYYSGVQIVPDYGT
ncbi:MAG: stage II sporulation protein SpoIID, partial [Desulfofundulus sp.]